MSTIQEASTERRTPTGSLLMPTEVTGWVRAMAWASLVANALLIATGGAVRLTGSGLGCPTWPRCTAESWTNTPAMGIHGYIEFGNRTLTFVLAAVAVLTFLSVWRLRDRFPGFFVLALVLGLGIPLQAVIGGITVRTGLNPWVVGIHFLLSAVLVVLSAILVDRTRRVSLPDVAVSETPGRLTGPARQRARIVAAVMAVTGALAVYFGTLVTGTGPHSGDAGEVARHAFDTYVIARIHVLPTYALSAAVLVALVLAVRTPWPAPLVRAVGAVAALLVAQAAIGYYQWFNGVPELAVALHLVGAAALITALTMCVEKVFHLSAEPTGDVPVVTA